MTHIWRPWKFPNFRDPSLPLSIYVQNSSIPLTLDVQFEMNPSSPNDNQSIKRKHNPRMTIMCYQVLLSSAFVFSINLLISSGFPLTSFQLAEASLCAFFFWLYTLTCRKFVLFIIIDTFSTHFATNLFYLHNLKT